LRPLNKRIRKKEVFSSELQFVCTQKATAKKNLKLTIKPTSIPEKPPELPDNQPEIFPSKR